MDIQYLMRQAKKLEKAMEEAKAKLADLEVEAESGGGLVKVKMNGRFELRRVEIDPQALGRLSAAHSAGKPPQYGCTGRPAPAVSRPWTARRSSPRGGSAGAHGAGRNG